MSAVRHRSAWPSPNGAFLTRVRSGATLGACVLLLACGGSASSGDEAEGGNASSGSAPPPTAPPTAQAPAGATFPPNVPELVPPPPAADALPAPLAAVSVKTELVTAGLSSPWSLAFLPDGSMLVTERPGSLRRITVSGQVSAPLGGVPAVVADGQGGLLDVVLSPGFASDRTIFFAYSEAVGSDESRTAIARARLDETSLAGVTVIYRQTSRPGATDFGSRLVFGRDGALFVTLSERRDQAFAQDVTTTLGKVVRILPDGGIPADNPVFPQAGAVAGLWSYGHRNPQGAALNPVTGELWISEHGPKGGDEINRVIAGRNYGWPRITYGRDYDTGEPIGEGTTAADVEPPLHYWVPISVAPAGIAFYTGDKLWDPLESTCRHASLSIL